MSVGNPDPDIQFKQRAGDAVALEVRRIDGTEMGVDSINWCGGTEYLLHGGLVQAIEIRDGLNALIERMSKS